VQNRKPVQQILAVRREFNQHFAAVLIAVAAFHGAMIDETVQQFHCAVVPKTQPLRKRGDSRTSARRHAFQGEKKLVLLRLNPLRTGSLFAEVKELTNAVPKLGKLAVTRN
jgi:hypothetical protein